MEENNVVTEILAETEFEETSNVENLVENRENQKGIDEIEKDLVENGENEENLVENEEDFIENQENEEDFIENQENEENDKENQENAIGKEKSSNSKKQSLTQLPLAKVKRIAKFDPDINLVSNESAFMLTCACV